MKTAAKTLALHPYCKLQYSVSIMVALRKSREGQEAGVGTPQEDGYTLVELMVGMILLSMLAISFFTLFTTLVRSALIIKRKAVASTLATTQMEYLKSLPYDSLAIQGGTITTTGTPLPATKTTKINGVNYTTITSIDYADDSFDNCASYPTNALKLAFCRGSVTATPSTDTNGKDYKIVHVSVYDANHYTLAEVDTEISARVAETASTTGAIFVQVLDQDNNPLAGATVNIKNTTLAPAVDKTDTTDTGGYAVFFDNVPDTNGYDYVITASKTGYSTLGTIAPSGTLVPNYPSQRVFTQASSLLTMSLKPMTSNSMVLEVTDTSGAPIGGLKVYAKGGYKKYTVSTDTSYYFDNFTPTDNRPTVNGSGLAAITDLVPGAYIFCGDKGDTNCKVGNTTYYLAAAIPYGGKNSFNPINVPSYSASSTNPTYTYSGNEYQQKVRLIFATSATFPRVLTISPYEADTSSSTMSSFAFTVTGVNLPCSSTAASCATSVKLIQAANTYTASCTGNATPATSLNCTINLSTAAIGSTQLQISNSGGTLTIPSGFALGGINVVP